MDIMQQIKELLTSGGYSCIVANGGEIRTFTQRGVADLHQLFHLEPSLLRGAIIADKIVGLGAAALMVAGGVEELFTQTISRPALEILKRNGVRVDFDIEVENIINRTQTDLCPVEKRCLGQESLEQMLLEIDQFMNEIKQN